MIQQAIDRVSKMEQCFDILQKAENENPNAFLEDSSVKEMLQILEQYYQSGQWLYDYELDEKGLIPQNIKRGVLSQDAVYDFFDRVSSIR